MIVIDLTKLPRPERSGCYGVLFHLVILGWAISPLGFANEGMCIPLLQRCVTEQSESRPEPKHKFLYTRLVAGKGKNTQCACHRDWRPFMGRFPRAGGRAGTAEQTGTGND